MTNIAYSSLEVLLELEGKPIYTSIVLAAKDRFALLELQYHFVVLGELSRNTVEFDK